MTGVTLDIRMPASGPLGQCRGCPEKADRGRGSFSKEWWLQHCWLATFQSLCQIRINQSPSPSSTTDHLEHQSRQTRSKRRVRSMLSRNICRKRGHCLPLAPGRQIQSGAFLTLIGQKMDNTKQRFGKSFEQNICLVSYIIHDVWVFVFLCFPILGD